MTDPDTRPTVPPIVGGIYNIRRGRRTRTDLYKTKTLAGVELFTDGTMGWNERGEAVHTNGTPGCNHFDLIELIAVAVPVQDLAQLRRAEAACRACIRVDLGEYESLDLKIKTFEAWLAHRTKGTL